MKKCMLCTCEKDQVQLCWSGCQPLPIHRRYPTTAPCGKFCLLHFCPGPVLPSLDNLGTLTSVWATILTQGLVRTPNLHRSMTSRSPGLKPSSDPSLPVAGLQECATIPSWQDCSQNSQSRIRCYFQLSHVSQQVAASGNCNYECNLHESCLTWLLKLATETRQFQNYFMLNVYCNKSKSYCKYNLCEKYILQSTKSVIQAIENKDLQI